MEGKILVVEDDIALRNQLAWFLSSKGFDVEECSDTAEAISILETEPISIVVLDLGLPPSQNLPDEGIKFIETVNRRFDPSAVKIIVLTGHETESAVKSAIAGGAFDYLIKPISPEHLLASVRRAVLFLNTEDKLFKEGTLKVSFFFNRKEGFKSVRDKAVESALKQVLRRTGHNIYRSAKLLSVNRENIYYFLKKFGMGRKNGEHL